MAALKSSFTDKIYDIKNQIEYNNTVKLEYDLVFSLREQIKLSKEENKSKHDITNTSKANNNSNNDKIYDTNRDHVSNTNTSRKENFKNKDSHKNKKNEKSSKEQKRKQETKEISTDQNTMDKKGKLSIFLMGNIMVKKLYGYLLTKKIKHEGIVKVRPFTTAKVSCTTSSLLFEIYIWNK